MSTIPEPQGKAMYVAPASDKAWLLSEQRKLYERRLGWLKPPAFAITDGEPGA